MYQELFNLTGKNVLITGSTRGLGLVYAQGFAGAGAHVILNGTNSEVLAQRVREFQSEGLSCSGYDFNVTNKDEVTQGIERIEKEVGPIHVLVNNAGIQRRGPLEQFAEEDWQKIMDVNLTAVWRVSKEVVQGMIGRGEGKIINIGSLLTFFGRANAGPYGASKGGVAALTRAMAVEWTPHNIQVNAIVPGYFITEMTQTLKDNKEFDDYITARTPARRWGDPQELVGLALLFASSASSFISGQIVAVDGGLMVNF